jgi:hypothetical protein
LYGLVSFASTLVVLFATEVETVTPVVAVFILGVVAFTVVVAVTPVVELLILVHVLEPAESDVGKLGIDPLGSPPVILKSSFIVYCV